MKLTPVEEVKLLRLQAKAAAPSILVGAGSLPQQQHMNKLYAHTTSGTAASSPPQATGKVTATDGHYSKKGQLASKAVPAGTQAGLLTKLHELMVDKKKLTVSTHSLCTLR
jgi:hypothetical protein